jgi:hypothetical protein
MNTDGVWSFRHECGRTVLKCRQTSYPRWLAEFQWRFNGGNDLVAKLDDLAEASVCAGERKRQRLSIACADGQLGNRVGNRY